MSGPLIFLPPAVAIPSAVFTTIVIEPSVIEPVMFESFVVKPSTAEVGSVIPFEIRTVVFIVDAVTVVATISGVVIVNIPGEFVLVYDGGRSRRISILAVSVLVLILANGSRGGSGILLIYYSGRGRRVHIYPDPRHTESDMGVEIYLRVGRAGDEGTCDDRSKDKQLFTHVHICLFKAFVILRVHFRRF